MKTTNHYFLFLFAAFILFSCNAIFADPPASQYPPKIDSFNAYPEFFSEGDTITLAWETSHTTQVHISGIGRVSTSGSRVIQNFHYAQGDIMLTASNDGNFEPKTQKLIIQIAKKSTKTPPASFTHLNSDKPILMIGSQASISQKLKKYKLKPVKRYSNIKPSTLHKATLPVAKRPMRAQVIPYNAAQLNAPQIISPQNNSTFSHYPRKLKLRWKPVNNAAAYNVEIDCLHCCASGKWCTDIGKTFKQIKALQNTYYQFNFVGSQPGRWRVQAVDKKGIAGKQSQWFHFKFTR